MLNDFQFFFTVKLKLTFFREAIIPPPMCGWEIEFSSSIRSVDFMSSDSSKLCVLTQEGLIHFLELTASETKDTSCHPSIKIICKEGGHFHPVWNHSAALDSVNFSDLYHWRFVHHSTVVACSTNQLQVFELDNGVFLSKYSIDIINFLTKLCNKNTYFRFQDFRNDARIKNRID